MTDKPRPQHLLRGEKAEQQALEFLRGQRLRLIEKNYRCPFGEIDLIMDERQTLVIVEVRFRQSDRYGSAAESVTWQKQSRIIASAEHYLMTHRVQTPVRFDVVAISGDQRIQWIKNAFNSSEQ